MASETHALPRVDAPVAGARVVVVEGADAGASCDVVGSIVIGTSQHCDLRLGDRTVSRRHVRVATSALGVQLRDEDSRNGTYVGSLRVREVELPLGTEFRIGSTRLRVEATESRAAVPARRNAFGRFLGESRALDRLYHGLTRAAASDATVLLEGESGTGKELLAEGIHEEGSRASAPFVVVDCGSLPETLIESELFGHERGAFTGASAARPGAFERANGGTVFLDEIGELPLAMQTRLLRVLDRRQVKRIGANAPIEVDVRVVAATNRNLEKEVEESRFRLDLFHRLAVVLLRVPPLRERGDDVVLLARHFVETLGGTLGDEELARLRARRWPGNVRQLRNAIERFVLLGELGPAGVSAATGDLDSIARSGMPYRKARALVLERFQASYVTDMLDRHGGNVSHAAKAAGVARRHFQRLKSSSDE